MTRNPDKGNLGACAPKFCDQMEGGGGVTIAERADSEEFCQLR